MTLRPDPHRPPIDYDLHREVAARLRAEMMNNIVAAGLSALTPSRRTLLTFGAVVMVATGAYWTVVPRELPETGGAFPTTPTQASPR